MPKPVVPSASSVADRFCIRPVDTSLDGGAYHGPGGGSGGRDPRGGDGHAPHPGPAREFKPEWFRLAMWVGLGSVLVMFAVLMLVFLLRARRADNWQPVIFPQLFWFSTAVLMASSATLEAARGSLKRDRRRAYIRRLLLTGLLGLAFLALQLLAWQQLAARGFYLTGNPHSAFFYLLTGAHGVHLLGGILALAVLLVWERREGSEAYTPVKRRTGADVTALYWHFMGGLWLCLFSLLLLVE